MYTHTPPPCFISLSSLDNLSAFHLIEVLLVFRPLSVALSYRKISPAKIQNGGSDVDAAREFRIFNRRRKCGKAGTYCQVG